jgi:hypothetical protein
VGQTAEVGLKMYFVEVELRRLQKTILEIVEVEEYTPSTSNSGCG